MHEETYSRSINRIVQGNFEAMYLRACQLNNGKPATAKAMQAVRDRAFTSCANNLTQSFAKTKDKHLDLAKIQDIQKLLAQSIAGAFEEANLSVNHEELLKSKNSDLLGSKISLHDHEISNEVGVAERFLLGIKKAQEQLPEAERLPAQSFELLRAILRISGGSFRTEASELRKLAQENKVISSVSRNGILSLVNTLKKLSSSVMFGEKYGGRREYFKTKNQLRPQVRVTKGEKYSGPQISDR